MLLGVSTPLSLAMKEIQCQMQFEEGRLQLDAQNERGPEVMEHVW